jgi:hypothetical protein
MRFDGSLSEVIPIDRLHSGVVPLDDGAIAYLAKQDEVIDGQTLLWDRIEELYPDGSTRVVFDPRDHLDPEILCEHHLFKGEDTGVEFFDWTHANALILSEDGTHYYMMLRNLDALMKVDRASGELLWILGGPYGEFTFEKEGDTFSHPHTSVVEKDRILVFDNANHSSPKLSRAVVYAIDEEQRSLTVERQVPEPGDGHISMLGDVKRSSEEGLLISWTLKGYVTEVDGNGEEVWRLQLPPLMAPGRVTLLPEFP